ncbi:septum formation initiator family protein [Spongiactinospora sp. TRM90649]|uniref:FtsB family cell division protein n=1 Tax=Spongiactinospora sp. TRM90649 TaxID=3031114 RepID=UPI0023F6A3BF|nr:septum formation initiator family protein [Spongiactinospora sp. TRM90649]MDF5754791.1 septum formation initiator family protein [Spongiactinospora sp. TRM90649]
MSRRPQLTGRAAVLAVVVCAIAMSLAYPVREFVAQRRQIAELQQEQARELAALQRLRERSKQLQDPGYTVRQARERLFYCEPGQKCFVVMDGDKVAAPGKPGRRAVARPPWYESLWKSVEAADHGVSR